MATTKKIITKKASTTAQDRRAVVRKKTAPSKKSAMVSHATLLRDKGLKATPARLAVLAYLSGVKEPRTVDEVLAGVKKSAIDLATVYRTLNALNDEGVVRMIDFRHGHAHYELVPTKDHHHLVCVSCGRVEDFHTCFSSAIIKAALKESKHFREVDEHSLELFGRCKKCVRV